MKPSQLIQENNQLRDQLTPENKTFYEDLLILVRTKSLFRREEIYEETLLSILQDLLDAQKVGKSAESYLGRDIETLANEIVAETPIEKGSRIMKFILIGWGIYLLSASSVSILSDLIFPPHHVELSIAALLLSSIFTAFLIGYLLKSLSANRWILKFIHKSFFWSWLRFIIPFSLVIAGYVLIFWLTQQIWVIHF